MTRYLEDHPASSGASRSRNGLMLRRTEVRIVEELGWRSADPVGRQKPVHEMLELLEIASGAQP